MRKRRITIRNGPAPFFAETSSEIQMQITVSVIILAGLYIGMLEQQSGGNKVEDDFASWETGQTFQALPPDGWNGAQP